MPVIHQQSIEPPLHDMPEINLTLRRDEDMESAEAAVAETVYVAVGRDVRKNNKTLQWTIQTFQGVNILILHVHQLVQIVPRPFWRKLYSCHLKYERKEYKQSAWRETEKAIAEYLNICAHEKVNATHIILDSAYGVHKGLVELIAQHAIRKLVMGAGTDKTKLEKLKSPTSKKAIYVNKHANSSCQIWFICEGQHIHTRQALSNQSERVSMHLLPASDTMANREQPAISSASYGKSPIVSCLPASNHVVHSGLGHSLQFRKKAKDEPSDTEATSEMSQLHSKNEEMRIESQTTTCEEMHELRREAFLESYRRCQAEEEARQAKESARISEASLAQAETAKKQAECLLMNAREEVNKLVKKHQTIIVEVQVIRDEKSALDAKIDTINAKLEAEHKKREKAEAALSEKNVELEDIRHQNQEIQKTLQSVTTYRTNLERRTTTMAKRLSTVQDLLKNMTKEREELRIQKDEAVRLKLILEDQIDKAPQKKAEIEKQRDDAVRDKFMMQRQRDNALNQVKELLPTEVRSKGGNIQKFVEFSDLELAKATKNFSSSMQIGEGKFSCVFKGRFHHTAIAIKMLKPEKMQNVSNFRQDVDMLSVTRHPHLRTLLGASIFQPALVYEYLQNGSLGDWMHSKNKSSGLPWYIRTRIVIEICSALLFLHSLGIVHGNLEASNIFLDDDLHVKIGSFGINWIWGEIDTEANPYKDPEFNADIMLNPASDVYSLGVIILYLLTGKPSECIVVEVQKAVSYENLCAIIDPTAGDWAFLQALELANIGLKCCSPSRLCRPDLKSHVWKVLESFSSTPLELESSRLEQGSGYPPPYFICPISQDIMRDPQVAADGFTYEGQVILKWLDSGHMTSPMTNERLNHSQLVPNHGLRSAIQEWLQKS